MSKILSMTGFASVTEQFQNMEIACEIRALNSRFLEMNVKLPRAYSPFEDAVKEIIREKIGRAKITLTINFTSVTPVLQNLKVDAGSIQLYKDLLNQIREVAGISEPLQLSHLLEFKDIISFEEETVVDEALQKQIIETVNKVIINLNQTRGMEGANLKLDIENRLANIQRIASEIQELGRNNAKSEFEKLYKRITALIDENKIDKNRMEMELALISDRVDIIEEVVRLDSHIQLFRENLNGGSPVGKKLNFILQEMNREANTISSKNTLIEISHSIVEIKEEIERIREQVQNIE